MRQSKLSAWLLLLVAGAAVYTWTAALLGPRDARAENTFRKKRGEYYNFVAVTTEDAAPKYFQRTSSAVTTTPSEFGVYFLRIRCVGGSVAASITIGSPNAANGTSESMSLPPNSSYDLDGMQIEYYQVTALEDPAQQIYLIAER